MTKYLALIGLLLVLATGRSQDTLTVIHYNLLNYGNTTSYCHNGNNNIDDKDAYLRTIIDYSKPDIFTVNEISESPVIHQHLLDQVLNTNGVDYYEKADFLVQAGSDIVNMMYFNSQKLALHSHFIAQDYIRDIDVYKLYHLNEKLTTGDTIFVICVVAHLKASSGTSNANKRKVMVSNAMNTLNSYDDDNNYLFMGDFNIYDHHEPSYQELLYYSNPKLQFIDPVNQYGSWHNNENYAHYHTQSTHSGNNGCAASGGMDDRFDFILISKNIEQGNRYIKYIHNSYWALGQDGKHFNTSLNAPPQNTSVPNDVLQALANNSDHLPVKLRLLIDREMSTSQSTEEASLNLQINNPANDVVTINCQSLTSNQLKISVYGVTGHLFHTESLLMDAGNTRHTMDISTLANGVYFVIFEGVNGHRSSHKLIKN